MDKKKEEQQRREDQETQDKSTLKSDPGTTHTQVSQYLLNGGNQFITSSTVPFTVITGGLQYRTTIPHYSVMAFLLQ